MRRSILHNLALKSNANLRLDIKGLIVTPPYFALHDLAECDGWFSKMYLQSSQWDVKMVLQQSGRHLAIIGSCALARVNPTKEKHYYLAHKAKLRALSQIDEQSRVR